VDVTEGDDFLGVYDQNVNINMDHILSGYGIMAVFNCHIELPGNRALQAALRGPELAGTGTVSETCNSQLALFTTGRQCALRPAVAFSKTCLKHRSV